MDNGKCIALTHWSYAGPSLTDAFACNPIPVGPNEPPLFSGDCGFYAGRLCAHTKGALVMQLSSPRPLRLWVNGLPMVDESLFWRQFQREVRGALLYPVDAGNMSIVVEVGPRPCHPPSLDESCPSRNRRKVVEAIEKARPDCLKLSAEVLPGVKAPALWLRFVPVQFVRGEVAWQHVILRHGGSYLTPPSVDQWSPADRNGDFLQLSSDVWPYDGVEGTTEDDRLAGVRRFFVPVASPGDEPEPLRGVGAETRAEPMIEPARTLRLTLTDHDGSIGIDMPGYESLGRLAPTREYSPAVWPEARSLRKLVPSPVLPPEMAKYGKLYYEAWEMLLRLARKARPESGLPSDYISTGRNFTCHQFVWDTSFTAICTAYGSKAFPLYSSMDLLYSRQFDGGYIHREHDIRDGLPAMYEPDFSPNPPIMSVAEWSMFGVTGDLLRLRKVYPALKANHGWLVHNRKLPDGTYWTTGLANGLDNSPSLGYGYPCLTAQMAHDAETLGKIAEVLGYSKEAAAFGEEHRQTGEALNRHLWSESMEIYSTSLESGGHNPNKVVTAFWPLWAGIVPPERAEALARHIKDPASFWRYHPVPSLAADSPHFTPEGTYWKGSTWCPTNYAVIKGFDRAGRHDIAYETAIRHIDVMAEVFEKSGFIWENYCCEGPERGSWSMSDYTWSALGPVALLIEVVMGIELDAYHRRIKWNPPCGKHIGIENLPFGSGKVSLVQEPTDEGIYIEINTDRQFELEYADLSPSAVYTVRPGRSRFLAGQYILE